MVQAIVPITAPRKPVATISGRKPLRQRYGTEFNVDGNFNRSINKTNGEQGRLTPQELIRISRTPLFDRAIERIANGVASMPWTVNLPPEKTDDEGSKKIAKRIEKAISHPNSERQETYTEFIKAIVRDILIFGVSAIERQPGMPDPDFQSFWLWAHKVENLEIDERWQAAQEGLYPRFWYRVDDEWNPGGLSSEWRPIYNQNLFLIKTRSSTRERVPPSPVEIAYRDMCTWLGLHGYQEETVTKAVRDYMICLKNEGDAGVQAFREYWENNVVGQGEIPIVGGEVDVVKFGAKTDQELFPNYTEYLAGLIALVFGLLKRDFGYVDDANYATADIGSQTSFQEGIRPVAEAVIEALDQKAVAFYHDGFSIGLADRNPQKELDEAERSDLLFDGGIMFLDEAREANGLSPVPGGDRFKDGRSSLADKYEEERLLLEQQQSEQGFNDEEEDDDLDSDEEDGDDRLSPANKTDKTNQKEKIPARQKREQREQRKQRRDNRKKRDEVKAGITPTYVAKPKVREAQSVQLTLF
jgi:hypothetical protein